MESLCDVSQTSDIFTLKLLPGFYGPFDVYINIVGLQSLAASILSNDPIVTHTP